VEERIAVPKAGVAGLLKRVLRTRLDQLRESVRAELRQRGGGALLIPDSAISMEEDTAYSDPSAATSSSSSTGFGVVLGPDSGGVPPSMDLVVSRPAPRPASSKGWIAFAYVLGILTGVAVTLLVFRLTEEPHHAALGAAPSPKSGATAAPRTPHTPEGAPVDRPAGASIDDLPMVGEDGENRGRSSARDEPRRANDRADRDEAARPAPPPGVEPLPEQPAEAPKETPRAEPAEEAPKPADLPPISERPPLNRGAAIAALGRAANSASSCKSNGGPTGSGTANVTFSPDGNVTSASVGGKFAGTPVGSCVAGLFRRARIPPFRGSPVSLSKTFLVPD
jgi:hypothetical protein